MVGIAPQDEEPTHCRGCGRPVGTCAVTPCGRGDGSDPHRFCTRCGWRLREIVVVPGSGARWCRVHGVVDPD